MDGEGKRAVRPPKGPFWWMVKAGKDGEGKDGEGKDGEGRQGLRRQSTQKKPPLAKRRRHIGSFVCEMGHSQPRLICNDCTSLRY